MPDTNPRPKMVKNEDLTKETFHGETLDNFELNALAVELVRRGVGDSVYVTPADEAKCDWIAPDAWPEFSVLSVGYHFQCAAVVRRMEDDDRTTPAYGLARFWANMTPARYVELYRLVMSLRQENDMLRGKNNRELEYKYNKALDHILELEYRLGKIGGAIQILKEL